MSTKLKITNDTWWAIYWTSVLLPFTNTHKRDTPTPQPVRAIDGIGHDVDGYERLLNRGELDHRKADCQEHPQTALKRHPRREIG